MLNPRIETELRKCVREGNLELLKNFLTFLDNFSNDSVQQMLGLLLHHATIPEIARELLNHRAEVDARNGIRETPLHSAISFKKGSTFIRELLKHGASVHASNYKGTTPLYLALMKENRDVEVIKALMEYGADINVQNRERKQFGNHYSALDIAIHDLELAKLLIKYALIQETSTDFTKIVNLEPFRELPNYKKLSAYLEECMQEVILMQTDVINNSLTVFDFVVVNEEYLANNYNFYTKCKASKDVASEVFSKLLGNKYTTVYQDVISARLDRAYLINKLSDVHVFTETVTDKYIEHVNLDRYSTLNISKYLSPCDILNLIKAFSNQN